MEPRPEAPDHAWERAAARELELRERQAQAPDEPAGGGNGRRQHRLGDRAGVDLHHPPALGAQETQAPIAIHVQTDAAPVAPFGGRSDRRRDRAGRNPQAGELTDDVLDLGGELSGVVDLLPRATTAGGDIGAGRLAASLARTDHRLHLGREIARVPLRHPNADPVPGCAPAHEHRLPIAPADRIRAVG